MEPTETTKHDEFVLKSPEKEFERLPLHEVSGNLAGNRGKSYEYFPQTRENDNKEEKMNGRTAINIPGELPSPKAKSPPVVAEKRNSLRSDQASQPKEREQREHREHHRDHNGAKVSNHHNNNKTNSACLNNLILPLLSDVSLRVKRVDRLRGLPENVKKMVFRKKK